MDSKKVYDQYWSSGLHPDPHWSRARIKREFAPIFGRNNILDYGCGLVSRKYGDVLAESAKRYVGADISAYVVKQNRAGGFESCTIEEVTGRVDFPDASFDGAVCCEVLEHLYDPLAASKEIYRLLKPGGVLVAMVPNFGYHAWRVQALLRAEVPHEPEDARVNAYNGVHIRYFGVRTFGHLLSDAGFANVRVTAYDYSTVWDIFRGLGKVGAISHYARVYLPRAAHLNWLQYLWPNLFAMRLKAFAMKENASSGTRES